MQLFTIVLLIILTFSLIIVNNLNTNLYTYKHEWFKFMKYQPHKGQSMLHFPKKKASRFFVIVCGRGYGKTYASAKEASFIASMPNKKVALVG